jgi:hypothetical protein
MVTHSQIFPAGRPRVEFAGDPQRALISDEEQSERSGSTPTPFAIPKRKVSCVGFSAIDVFMKCVSDYPKNKGSSLECPCKRSLPRDTFCETPPDAFSCTSENTLHFFALFPPVLEMLVSCHSHTIAQLS